MQLSNESDFESVLVGDFNINASPKNPSHRRFQEIFPPYGALIRSISQLELNISLRQYWIFLTSLSPEDVSAGVISCYLGDHLPIYILLPRSLPCKSKQDNLMRHYFVKNIVNCEAIISAEDLDLFLNRTETNCAYNAFYVVFLSAYNTCFPLEPQKTKKHVNLR